MSQSVARSRARGGRSAIIVGDPGTLSTMVRKVPVLMRSAIVASMACMSSCYIAPVSRASRRTIGRALPPATMLFENVRFPWEEERSAEEPGQFLRHNDLQPGCAPLGVVCAGFDDDALEALAATIEDVMSDADGKPMAHVPIAVLGRSDLRLRLRDVLAQYAAPRVEPSTGTGTAAKTAPRTLE